MKTKSRTFSFIALSILPIILITVLSLTIQPVLAESNPPEAATQYDLDQGGDPIQEAWDAFWAQFKVWLEQLALVFAEMPILGSVLAQIFRFIGAANVWFCGAVLFIIFLLGILRR